MRGPNIEKIGRVSREIEGRVWDMGAKRTEHGGRLEKRLGRLFFESRHQGNDMAGAWTNLDACKRHG
jgi:hypothetical protein